MMYIGGRVELDGKELPIWDDDQMDDFRYNEVSIIPQYAMSALEPDAQDRADDRRASPVSAMSPTRALRMS